MSRRNFIGKSALTSGMAAIMPLGIISGTNAVQAGPGQEERSPSEIWIAGVSQMGIHAADPNGMVERITEVLEQTLVYKPDFVCLPELFPFSGVDSQMSPSQRVEASDKILEYFSGYAKKNNCYLICPVHTSLNGKIYNSAVFFDRSGKRTGTYRKIHLADYEIKDGYTCGPLFQPVIETEFGPVGIQICFDMEWDDGWTMLRSQGAKIIFWPSAFAGGKCVGTKAWEHKCIVATATNKNTARLCDISGDTIAATGIWNPNVYCAPVNMEKAFLHTWPSVLKFEDIQKKYGRKIRITNYHEEEWSVIESLSADVKVKDVLKEYGLRTHEELTKDTEMLQNRSRE